MTVRQFKQETDRNQGIASDPDISAWVSANAGTGKTTVLVNRVLRLLLHRDPAQGTYTRPEAILCLTYTKAAAAEMENRLFGILSRWSVMPEAELAGELKDRRGIPAMPSDIVRARQLFATALDAKGGLKIQTIHAFCERLLHRFPMEAGVQADFDVVADQEQRALRNAAIDAVLTRAVEDPDSALGRALSQIVFLTGEERFRDIIGVALSHREDFLQMMRVAGSSEPLSEEEQQGIATVLGVDPLRSETDLVAEIADILSDGQIDAMLADLPADKPTERNLLAALERVRGQSSSVLRAAALRDAFLTQQQKPRKTLLTKAVAEKFPEYFQQLTDAQERIASLAGEQAALTIARSTGALLALCDAIFQSYARLKATRAVLDYDDLIVRTIYLLESAQAAAWVLYKLDYGIDHILVDEAQDTSPLQWRVIDALAQEFFSGEGARDTARTLFAVGDEKQSIYSFQGADPESFATHGRKFGRAAEGARAELRPVPLTVSFRSTEPVLTTVDEVFAGEKARSGMSWAGAPVVHKAIRENQPGLVEMWALEVPEDHTPAHPMRPHEEPPSMRQTRDKLAERIARTIRQWLDRREFLPSQGRAVRPGDILVLVRTRDAFVTKLIRALKSLGVPVAGADRMKLTEQLAVMDLMAVADFALMPEDDLSLATVLKSPLVGFDDDDLFAIGYGRSGSLWRALRDKARTDTRYAAAIKRLTRWLNDADMEPPYEFFARVLEENRMQLRLALIARLGPEAGDAIDEFLNLALEYEKLAPPSLQGFLDWMRRSEVEVTRDMEQERNEVRIMTVHGAKGLEANIVILPDTCKPPTGRGGSRPKLLPLPRAGAVPGAADHLVWVPSGTKPLDAIETAKTQLAQIEREEHNRLLYVAMTRARDRLYVCGWQQGKELHPECWYALVRDGLKELGKEAPGALGEPVFRYEIAPDGDFAVLDSDEASPPVQAALEPWAVADVPHEESATLPLTPSTLSAASEDDGQDVATAEQDVEPPLARIGEARFQRGNIIHALLQYLPAIPSEQREERAFDYVKTRGGDLDEKQRDDIVSETLGVLSDDIFASVFGPDSLAEVPVVAQIDRQDAPPLRLVGQIDRLVVRDDDVLIVDYKTNRPPPDTPEKVVPLYKRQLAAYRSALRRIYPEKQVRAALLWTAEPRIMEIPSEVLDEAAAGLRVA
ncbi:MAG: double-strand break repair helicase AddA [Hyphomicrobiaceae bacterium]|nr:double-strand break repair helicase AddA [Hyphomicrobiaceae bacterium]